MDRPPKIRDDLIIKENIRRDGSKYFVVKDPVTNSFFQVGEAEYSIMTAFNGRDSFAQITERFKSETGADLQEKEVREFADQLQDLCFLDNDLTRQELLKKQRSASRSEGRSLFGRLLYIKIKAINPGTLFDSMIGHVRCFFTPRFVYTAGVLIALAILISLYNGRAIADSVYGLLNLQGIIIIYVSMFIIIVAHEFAHGLTCRYYGGNVNDIGFMLMYFQPTFYCNVSDAWLFAEKSQRLWVSFSGAFFQLFLWALAVFIWRATAPELLINKIALAVLSFSGIATLFNFNPLLKYDGYYLLSDYLEIPNLRHRAGLYWRRLAGRLLLGRNSPLEDISARERRIFFYYGVLSFIYVVFILGYFFLLAGRFLVSRLGGTGLIIFIAALLFLFRNIIMDAVKAAGEMMKAQGGFLRKRSSKAILLAALIIAVVIIIFGHWELRIKGELTVNPLQSLLLRYNSAGFVELVQYEADNRNSGQQRNASVFASDYTTTRLIPLVKIGDTVSVGQVIARLANTETSQLINEYSANLNKAEEELSLLIQGPRPQEIEEARNNMIEMEARLKLASQNLQRMNDMLGKGLVSKQDWEDAQADSLVWDARWKAARSQLWMLKAGTRPEEIKAKKAEIERLKSQIEFHSRQLESYEFKSSINGIVLRVDTGVVACEIANLDTMEARIVLSENELGDIAIGQKVKFKARSYPSLSFHGDVYRIDGKIETDHKGNRVCYVLCRVPNEKHILLPGMTGVANIYAGDKKISYHIYRKFFRAIRTEFWDWFDWL
jgi:putative peptide zinc metalloprotease protein